MNKRKYLQFTFASAMALLVAAPRVSAHEKWFHDATEYGLRWDLFFRPAPLAFAASVALVTLAAWFYWRARGGRGFVPGPEDFGTTDERRMALYGLIPLILGVHVAVPLFVYGVTGKLFAPSNELPGVSTYFVGLALTGIALSLFYGGLTRLAGVALAVLWCIGIAVIGLEAMLESIMYLGFAAFFFLAGRGPISIDRLLLPRLEPSPALMARAVSALRVGLGLSLVFVAFTEKFANLPLAESFLERYPLNFTHALGIGMSNEIFILCAGSVELLVGLWILFNIFPREIILIAWVPVNMTLTIFNWAELVGHLPIYGALAVLLIWSSGDENRALWLGGLRRGPLGILKPGTAEVESAATVSPTRFLHR
jgi:hypothetical protein